MESIRIEASGKTPLFILRDGYIQLSGRSIPQNSRQLYKTFSDWVEQYVKSPAQYTRIDLYFEYIDTSSIRCIVDVLTVLADMHKSGDNKIEINWYYEKDDDDAFDLGAYIQANLKVPFNIIPIEEGTDIPE
jgi:hypothetical protein